MKSEEFKDNLSKINPPGAYCKKRYFITGINLV